MDAYRFTPAAAVLACGAAEVEEREDAGCDDKV